MQTYAGLFSTRNQGPPVPGYRPCILEAEIHNYRGMNFAPGKSSSAARPDVLIDRHLDVAVEYKFWW